MTQPLFTPDSTGRLLSSQPHRHGASNDAYAGGLDRPRTHRSFKPTITPSAPPLG